MRNDLACFDCGYRFPIQPSEYRRYCLACEANYGSVPTLAIPQDMLDDIDTHSPYQWRPIGADIGLFFKESDEYVGLVASRTEWSHVKSSVSKYGIWPATLTTGIDHEHRSKQ